MCLLKQKTAYELRSSDWSSDVCSSDLLNSDLSVPATGNSHDVLITGSRGLTLSSYEVAEILTVYENNLLITASWVNEMKIKKCGFGGAGVHGTHGTYYWKHGGGTNSEGPGGETIIMIFPNEVRVSLNCNSNLFTDAQFVGKR